ncbi:hypothetical protein GWI33_010948 [Rhynchophorus ferrugineus]|uniref:DUF1289 domain-containing protein n=1 Tax=Rhynchophorus ferrugineus TaxID=354439 RepID=A0A834M9W0_RHYFE|nr:hypothetical protein GWI33_010948 [Rhynchophorus ferrugineus]
MSNLLIKTQTLAALTPCAGRCSTVFGDSVCRGCRRFNHEVIHWNRYSDAEKTAVWQRLDAQLDQILIPMLPQHDLNKIMHFLQHKRIRLMPNASLGRKLYHALKLCEKMPACADESGLGLTSAQIKPIWKTFEQRVLSLAQASYELAWLRARFIHQNINDLDDEL